ncbi:MAG TPA: bifunctional 2-C-methyl-D-erythritol 4-phosphate cytidylyltransferase/2-C-methyl-D-erythritol 2,4-cyclodiphosphate synthase [Rhodospirillales bacterium]|nr:bifunctional 2-C-methyl-D-erythritol 4-phosphate cytidylyltransferase/2-C-methyl-D-erythritol 2,4-cyclodiphosphate synthase [Rhodospirillales bacterium]
MGGTVALVVGAGEGQRFGGELPKQYHLLAGVAVMRRSLKAFMDHPDVSVVQAVIHPNHHELYDAAVQGLALPVPVDGGATRQGSVLNGLESLNADEPSTVLIHDAARPLVDPGVISRVLAALQTSPGAIPALAVADTLKRSDGQFVETTVDRQGLWRAQTPQGFHYQNILAAHRQAGGDELTDDAAVAERAGLAVAIVEGSEDNVKVTRTGDMVRAERILGAGETRTGLGFDVHRFGPGDHVMLCGVKVPHEFGLEGHSDADVGLHAVTDALLGAIGEGDIGTHFPPSDPQWKGTGSDIFLRHAGDVIAGMGGRISNIDVTLICEQPKIGPHRAAMIKRMAEILSITEHRISIKATTTERLGFTGRGEGIAAQAAATVVL